MGAIHQREAQSFWQGFKTGVKDDVRAAGYLSTHRGKPFGLATLVALGLVAFAVVVFANDSPLGFVSLAGAIGIFLAMRVLRQRTPAGARRAAEWEALRRFLKDFSRLDEAVSGDLVLYERYLVAAVALGVANELVRGLAVKVPEVVSDPGFATWYLAPSLGDGLGAPGFGRPRGVRLHLRRHHRGLHPAVQQLRGRRRRLLGRWRWRRGRRRVRCQLGPSESYASIPRSTRVGSRCASPSTTTSWRWATASSCTWRPHRRGPIGWCATWSPAPVSTSPGVAVSRDPPARWW